MNDTMHFTCARPLYNHTFQASPKNRSKFLQPLLLQTKLGSIALALTLSISSPAFAENVRVEDVESPTMRAGLEASNKHQLDIAERFFKTYLVNEDPNSASAYSNLGMTHLEMGKTDIAIQDFTKAIDLAQNASVPLLNRAIAYEQLGVDSAARNPQQALKYYKLGLEDAHNATLMDPLEFAAWFNKGNIQMRLEDYEGSLESFRKAADLAQIPGYRLRAAALEYQTGDIERAQQQLRGLVRKYPNYAEAYTALAAIEWVERQDARAEEHLARATELDSLWGDEKEVRKNTRWPPRLYDAYSKLLKIS